MFFKHLKIELSSQVIRERIIQVKELHRKIDSLYLVVFAFEEAHINVIWEDSEEKDGEITY